MVSIVTKAVFFTGYGMTEGTCVTSSQPVNSWKHSSVGMLVPNTIAKVLSLIEFMTKACTTYCYFVPLSYLEFLDLSRLLMFKQVKNWVWVKMVRFVWKVHKLWWNITIDLLLQPKPSTVKDGSIQVYFFVWKHNRRVVKRKRGTYRYRQFLLICKQE